MREIEVLPFPLACAVIEGSKLLVVHVSVFERFLLVKENPSLKYSLGHILFLLMRPLREHLPCRDPLFQMAPRFCENKRNGVVVLPDSLLSLFGH